METFGDFIMIVKDKVEEIGITLFPNHYSKSVMNWESPRECTGYKIYVRDQLRTNMGVSIQIHSSWRFEFVKLLRIEHHDAKVFIGSCSDYFRLSMISQLNDHDKLAVWGFMVVLDEAVKVAKVAMEVAGYIKY